MLKRYDATGVIIGRFQIDDLHEGHKAFIDSVIEKHTKVIIFIGVSKALGTKNNPLDYPTREMMIRSHYPTVIVQALPDMKSDVSWSKNLDNLIRIISPVGNICLYGSRDSFIPYYKGRYETKEVDQTIDTSATKRRTELSLHTRESAEFRIGAIYHSFQQFPKAMLAVDGAILKRDYNDFRESFILLARKPNEIEWRFPGGFVDPSLDNSGEDAVIREIKEETNLLVNNAQYIGSFKVNDWRYKSESDKIFTNFYCVEISDLSPDPIAMDDIGEVKWVRLGDIVLDDLVTEHQVLFKVLLNWLS